jgi:L,D-transpeptidase YbiS
MELDDNQVQVPEEIPAAPTKAEVTVRIVVKVLKTLLFFLFLVFIPVYLLFLMSGVQNAGIRIFGAPNSSSVVVEDAEVTAELLLKQAEKELRKNETKLNALAPKQPYMVINRTENRFWLYGAKGKFVREGVCSTGSYITLDNGKKRWTFETPKGVRKVLGKTTDPVWTKPDWAFIEEGLPVPGPQHRSRYEYGVLGDYALYLGDGYMIHGTIYQRFLGLPVTHGCVRIGDDDLEDIYKTLPVGSKVYIY